MDKRRRSDRGKTQGTQPKVTSISITVRSAMYISEALGGRSIRVEVNKVNKVNKNADISALLEQLSETYGDAFRDFIFNKDGSVKHGHFAITLNGRNIFALDGFNCALQEGDDVLILPAISGG